MTRQPCAARHYDELCGREKLATSSLYCYWDRLSRQSITEQVKAAEVRRSLATEPVVQSKPKKLWPPNERWCSGCQSFVPLWYCTTRREGKTLTRCRACAHASQARTRSQSIYGVGPERKKEILKKQRGACAGCRKGQVIKDLAMDHNHKTGKWRGILCQTCNHKVIGGAYESVNILLSLAYYLLNPPAFEGSDWEPPEDLVFSLTVRRRDLD